MCMCVCVRCVCVYSIHSHQTHTNTTQKQRVFLFLFPKSLNKLVKKRIKPPFKHKPFRINTRKVWFSVLFLYSTRASLFLPFSLLRRKKKRSKERQGKGWRIQPIQTKTLTTFNGGSLGSCNDEERCELRYVMRIAQLSESSKF
jgi:hypothetical protein